MKLDCQSLSNARHKYDDILCQYDTNLQGKLTKIRLEDKSGKAMCNIIFYSRNENTSQMKIK